MTNNNNGPEKARSAWRRRLGMIVVAGLLIAVAGFAGFRKWNAPKVEKNEFYKVKRGDIAVERGAGCVCWRQ